MIYRHIALCCFLWIIGLNSMLQAQGFVEDSVKYGPGRVYLTPDVTATFPGGKARMFDYVKLKFEANDDLMASDDKVKEGIIEANFVVEANGRIQYVKIINGYSPLYDEEMVRALEAMPKWKPAMVNGENVRSLQTIRYKLDFFQR
jgi:hypothetical protein